MQMMTPFIVCFILLLLSYTTTSQESASCYYYGCGFYNPSYLCQCNSACVSNNDCCSDFQSLCTHGNFEECPSSPIIKHDRRTNKNILKIVSFNIEWLFLDYSHSMGGNYCPGNGCDWHNTSGAYFHMNTVANYLDTFNADIILLQETCDCWTIQQLINSMINNGQYYKPYLLRGTDTATGQNVALITKIDPHDDLTRSDERVAYPVPGSTCGYSGNPGDQGCSKHFRSRFKIDGLDRDLSIFNLHFLAFPDDVSRCVRREGQASVIANMIKEDIGNGNLIIVAGDYNDFSSSVNDINNNKPISTVETIMREAGDLINIATAISNQNARYASWWNCQYDCVVTSQCFSMIDHVLVSINGLYDILDYVYIDHGFENGCATWYSDHYPYIMQFDLTMLRDTNNTLIK